MYAALRQLVYKALSYKCQEWTDKNSLAFQAWNGASDVICPKFASGCAGYAECSDAIQLGTQFT